MPTNTFIVLRVCSKDGLREYRKAWPYDNTPVAGQHVSVPYYGYETPQRVAIRQVAWVLADNLTLVELHQQNSLVENPSRHDLDDYYLAKGWKAHEPVAE